MHKLKVLFLSTLLIYSVQSRGALAVVGSISGAPAASKLALAGLGSIASGYLVAVGTYGNRCVEFDCLNAIVWGWALGLVLLEDEGELSFGKIASSEFRLKEVSHEDIAVYNSEIEEVNIVFEEVKASLNSTSTVEQAIELWEDYSDFLHPSTYKVLQALSK